MENKETDVITFFYERGKSKANHLRIESADIVLRKVFCRGEWGAIFCESILKTSANGVNQCKR